MKKIIFLLLIIAFCFAPGCSRVNAEVPRADQKNVKAEKGFGAQLWLTDDAEFYKKWHAAGAGFQFHKVNVVKRGQPILVIILFAGPGVNNEGLCDITCDIVARAPDGSIYGQERNIDCWKNLPAPPKNNILVSQSTMGITIEKKDKPGRYTVDVKVRDNIKKVEITLQQYFDV